jgi:sulfotransferase family protein
LTGRPAPVFIGGTGRSGTHVLARLLDRHPELASVPIEARFHCNVRGMPDLLGGRVSLAGYLEKLREFWWHRVRVDDQPRGLYNLMTRASFDAALAGFESAYRENPVGACRALFWDLLGPWADGAGKPRLVEMSSHNIKEAQTLRRLFGSARFVHAVRDGRDAASSVTTKTWGPDDVISAIGWWAERLRAIDAGISGSEDGTEFTLPSNQLCVIVLDDLVARDRGATYGRLLSHVGVDDAPAMREFYESEMSAASANRGRWATGLGWLGRRRVRWRYERTLAALQMEGNHAAAPLIAAYERDG